MVIYVIILILLLNGYAQNKPQPDGQAERNAVLEAPVGRSAETSPPVGSGSAPFGYYNAIDFDLPAGKVIAYSPPDSYISNLTVIEGRNLSDITIQIQQDDGQILVRKVKYQTWLILKIGAILK